jgi:hypothetical protein
MRTTRVERSTPRRPASAARRLRAAPSGAVEVEFSQPLRAGTGVEAIRVALKANPELIRNLDAVVGSDEAANAVTLRLTAGPGGAPVAKGRLEIVSSPAETVGAVEALNGQKAVSTKTPAVVPPEPAADDPARRRVLQDPAGALVQQALRCLTRSRETWMTSVAPRPTSGPRSKGPPSRRA